MNHEQERKRFSRRQALMLARDIGIVGVAATVEGTAVYKGVRLLHSRFSENQEHKGPEIIDLSRLPENLPEAVKESSFAALDITTEKGILSGVKIGNYHILTAGHALRTPTDQLIPVTNCHTNMTITGRTETESISGAKMTNRIVSSRSTDDSKPDIALIELTYPLGGLPNAPIASRTPNPNTPLFFVNYEPDAYGNDRTPTDQDKLYRSPALFGGIIVGTIDKNNLAVITSLKNYAQGGIPDTDARPGASGGPVFNSDGELIGLSVAGYDQKIEMKIIESLFGVKCPGVPSDKLFGVSFIEPVTPHLLRTLETKLRENPDACNLIKNK